MRGGGKKCLKLETTWHLGVFWAFRCVLLCVCGVKTCILCVFGSQMCLLKVALCTGTCSSEGTNFDLHPPPRSVFSESATPVFGQTGVMLRLFSPC